jgi:urease accessory protein UreF
VNTGIEYIDTPRVLALTEWLAKELEGRTEPKAIALAAKVHHVLEHFDEDAHASYMLELLTDPRKDEELREESKKMKRCGLSQMQILRTLYARAVAGDVLEAVLGFSHTLVCTNCAERQCVCSRNGGR